MILRDVFTTVSNIYDGASRKNSLRLKVASYFRKGQSQMFVSEF